ncbi:MAG: hypothetical protein IJC16_07425 [Rikenellaceae bacterium]|nr:hypothetical protein [Rikenellaceae bacterium]
MKKAIQIVLAVVIVVLAFVVYKQIMTPMKFQEEQDRREKAVIERLKYIRDAQRGFKKANQRYTGSFDTLINFVLNDTLEYEKIIGSDDDSVAVARGQVRREKFRIAAIDTVFGTKKLSPDVVKQLPYIPFGNGAQFIMGAGQVTTAADVVVPVFEAKAPYKVFLGDLDQQELINLLDDRRAMDKYKGLKVGDLEQATNDAGNWE